MHLFQAPTVLLALFAAAAAHASVITDDFTDTPGTLLTDRTASDGQTWKLSNTYAGTLSVTADNRATNVDADGDHAFNYIDTLTVTDQIVTARLDVQLNASTFATLALGDTLDANYFSGPRLIGVLQKSGPDRYVTLQTSGDGDHTTTVQFSDLPDNTSHSMELIYNHSTNQVSFSIDGIYAAQNLQLTGTYDGLDQAGIFVLYSPTNSAAVDNFFVQVPEPASLALTVAGLGLALARRRR